MVYSSYDADVATGYYVVDAMRTALLLFRSSPLPVFSCDIINTKFQLLFFTGPDFQRIFSKLGFVIYILIYFYNL